MDPAVSETDAAKRARHDFIATEDALLRQRRVNNAQAIRDLVGAGHAAAHDDGAAEEDTGGDSPRVAVLLSGGGWRAMLSGAAFLDGLAETGLLDCTETVLGVSGGSWCAAQLAFANPAFNPFHMTRGPNPWAFGNRPDPTQHTFDGIVKMVSEDHVRSSYDINYEARWYDFLHPSVNGWAKERSLRYLTGTGDDTLLNVGVRAGGQTALTRWADFIGRSILGAWSAAPTDWKDIDFSTAGAVQSGYLPNMVMCCISSDVLKYGDVASDAADSTDARGAPGNVWCEFSVAGLRNYVQHRAHSLPSLRQVPITEDNMAFVAPVYDIRGADRMALCGSAFAYDLNRPLAGTVGRICGLLGPMMGRRWRPVEDGAGRYVHGSKAAVGTAGGEQIGRIRDAGLDINLPFPGALSPDAAATAGRGGLRNLLFTSGRKFDLLLVHDASGGNTGAKTLADCIDRRYYELSEELHPRGHDDLADIAEPKNGDRDHDLDQLGCFRVFYPKSGTTLPIIVFMLGVCCEPSARVIYDEATVLRYLHAVRERTVCMAETGQRNNKCVVGPNNGEGYSTTVQQLLRRLRAHPSWRGSDLPPPPPPPSSHGGYLPPRVNLEAIADELRRRDAASPRCFKHASGADHDSGFMRVVLHTALRRCGISLETPSGQWRDSLDEAFSRLADLVHRHALSAGPSPNEPRCTIRPDDPLCRLDCIVLVHAEESASASGEVPCDFRRGCDTGVYDFVLSFAILRAAILRHPSDDPTAELAALYSVYNPQDRDLPPDAVVHTELERLTKVFGDQRVKVPEPVPIGASGLQLSDFPRALRYAADAAAALHFSIAHHRQGSTEPIKDIKDPRAAVVDRILGAHAEGLRRAVLLSAATDDALATYHARHATSRATGVESAVGALTVFQRRWSQHYEVYGERHDPETHRQTSWFHEECASLPIDKDVVIPSDPNTSKWLGGLAALTPVVAKSIVSRETPARALCMFVEAVMRHGNVELFDALVPLIVALGTVSEADITAPAAWMKAVATNESEGDVVLNRLSLLVRSGNHDAVERFIVRCRAYELNVQPETGLGDALELEGPQMAQVLLDNAHHGASQGSSGNVDGVARRNSFANRAVAAGRWRTEPWIDFLLNATTEMTIDDAPTAAHALDFARDTVPLRRLTLAVSMEPTGTQHEEFDALLHALREHKGMALSSISAYLGYSGRNGQRDIAAIRSGRSSRHTLGTACRILRRHLEGVSLPPDAAAASVLRSYDERAALREKLRAVLFRGPITRLRDIDFGPNLGSDSFSDLVVEWLSSPDSNQVATLRTQAVVPAQSRLRDRLVPVMTTAQTLVVTGSDAVERHHGGLLLPSEKMRRPPLLHT